MKLSKSYISLEHLLKSKPLSQDTIDKLEKANEQALQRIIQNKNVYLDSNVSAQFHILNE